RLRRVLGEGYRVDDLHAAMREHQLALAEEIEYERRQSSPRFRSIMRVLLGSSIGGLGLGAWIWRHAWDGVRGTGAIYTVWEIQELVVRILFFAASGFTISAVALGGEYARLHLAHRVASRAIGFWKSKWGARLAKLASLGLKKVERPTLGMPLLTEVALGRATDHLFEALPKASRRELAALPETVRRLETDAGRLRASVVALDDQLAAFDRGGDALADEERTRVANELRATRVAAAERLATTVAAIEAIRLDLLRLQMGSVGLESVTASLDAARSIGEQIAASLEAQEVVERLLRDNAPRPVADVARDDTDTPVQGVAPATP
ncbi:MAG TPA: hypothetical protein VFP90_01560, partial [Gemmatimonadaceae bacterium]|nr:hypothetical protein [Gemmatimonadaceae bacterium]